MSGAARRCVRLDLTGAGTGSVVVDGRDIAHLVRAVSLDAAVGELPVVRLELPTMANAALDARVEVGAETRVLLLELGWAPPIGEEYPDVETAQRECVARLVAAGAAGVSCARCEAPVAGIHVALLCEGHMPPGPPLGGESAGDW